MRRKRFSAHLIFIPVAAALIFFAPKSWSQPNITLNSPVNETFFAAPATINLDAFAEDFVTNISKVEFFTNNVLLATVTNTSGGETFSASYLWTNIPVGDYSVTAMASNANGQTNLSDPAWVVVYTNTGALAISINGTPPLVNLTTNGTADWVHWGLYWANTFNHKSGVVSQISNYQVLNYGTPYSDQPAGVAYTWTDGMPVNSATGTSEGAFTYDGEFQFTVAASTNAIPRTLKIYLGASSSQGRLLVYLSDFSAAPISDTSVVQHAGTRNDVYTVTFRAAATNQFLVIRYGIQTINYIGTVNLQAATLTTGNLPPQVAITNPAAHSVYQYPTNLAMDAAASDADGSISKVEFFDGVTKIGELTSSPYHFIWTNTPAGLHSLTARATDNGGVTFTSSAIDTFVATGGGFLSGSLSAPTNSVDLTSSGRTDWAHWGLVNFNSFDHRGSVAQRISDATKIGGGPLNRLTVYPIGFSWTNGTPTAQSGGSGTGIFIYGANKGFQITAPADTLKRRLKLYLSAYAALGRLEASLSDASAVSFVDYSVSNVFNNSYGVYTIDYAAASSNKTLTVKFTAQAAYESDYGNVTVEAATLAMLDSDLRKVQKTGDVFSFSFPSDDAQPYALEYTTNLVATNWTTLTNFFGNGVLTNLVDTSATNTQTFYRVKTQ
ncbi:MAG: large repetitive protein [Verrucomicrobiota bacterium]